jgi:hypothetical protein
VDDAHEATLSPLSPSKTTDVVERILMRPSLHARVELAITIRTMPGCSVASHANMLGFELTSSVSHLREII